MSNQVLVTMQSNELVQQNVQLTKEITVTAWNSQLAAMR